MFRYGTIYELNTEIKYCLYEHRFDLVNFALFKSFRTMAARSGTGKYIYRKAIIQLLVNKIEDRISYARGSFAQYRKLLEN